MSLILSPLCLHHLLHPTLLLSLDPGGTREQAVLGSIVVSISACHAEDPGLIPGRGALFFLLCIHCFCALFPRNNYFSLMKSHHSLFCLHSDQFILGILKVMFPSLSSLHSSSSSSPCQRVVEPEEVLPSKHQPITLGKQTQDPR